MNIRKKFLSTVAVLSLAVLISGCSPSAEKVKEGVTSSLSEIESYRMNHKLSGEIASSEGTNTILSDYNFEIVTSPLYQKIETLDVYDGEESSNTVYILKSEDGFSTYMPYEDAWIKQDLDESYSDYVENYYNYPKTLENLFEIADSFKMAGSETVDNVKYLKGTLSFNGEKIKEVLSLLNAANANAFPQNENLFADTDSLEISLLFDKTNYLPVKYSCDLAFPMQKVFDYLYGAHDHEHEEGEVHDHEHIEITVNNYTLESRIWDVNAKIDTSLPEEASSALTFEEYYANLMSEYYAEQTEELPEE